MRGVDASRVNLLQKKAETREAKQPTARLEILQKRLAGLVDASCFRALAAKSVVMRGFCWGAANLEGAVLSQHPETVHEMGSA